MARTRTGPNSERDHRCFQEPFHHEGVQGPEQRGGVHVDDTLAGPERFC